LSGSARTAGRLAGENELAQAIFASPGKRMYDSRKEQRDESRSSARICSCRGAREQRAGWQGKIELAQANFASSGKRMYDSRKVAL